MSINPILKNYSKFEFHFYTPFKIVFMRWTIKPIPEFEKIKTLSEALQVDSLIAQLLLQRGITTYEEARQFFRPTLNDLHHPFLMKGR